jgi:hypothetical protein
MRLQRDWITPATIGAFTLSAVTGVLMFFHFDMALNKLAHEWLSWVLVAAVVAHVLTNLAPFKRHLKGPRGQAVVGAFVLVLGLSFFPLLGSQKQDGPPFAVPVQALAHAPLTVLAQVGGVPVAQMRERLLVAGVATTSDDQRLDELVGPAVRKQLGVLKQVLTAPATATATSVSVSAPAPASAPAR